MYKENIPVQGEDRLDIWGRPNGRGSGQFGRSDRGCDIETVQIYGRFTACSLIMGLQEWLGVSPVLVSAQVKYWVSILSQGGRLSTQLLERPGREHGYELFITDRFLGIEYGRPFMVLDEDCDQFLLSPLEGIYHSPRPTGSMNFICFELNFACKCLLYELEGNII